MDLCLHTEAVITPYVGGNREALLPKGTGFYGRMGYTIFKPPPLGTSPEPKRYGKLNLSPTGPLERPKVLGSFQGRGLFFFPLFLLGACFFLFSLVHIH